jgi:hypothetical protein
MTSRTPAPRKREASLEERLQSASSLHQIESHEWSSEHWAESELALEEAEAAVALARGRVEYEKFLRSGPGGYPAPGVSGAAALPHFRRAAELFQRVGEARGEAESLFWLGTLQQVLEHDYGAARESLERARSLATSTGDRLVLSSVERHLGFVAMLTGDPAGAKQHLESSTRLRRELGFWPGVAMALIAEAELAIEHGDPEGARRALTEAGEIARAHRAAGAIAAVDHARSGVKDTKGETPATTDPP